VSKRKEFTSSPSLSRHEAQCSICAHPKREEIDHDFMNWENPTGIATAHGVSRDAIYRHARAMSLMDKRQRNVRSALEKIIEKSGDVEVNASAIVSAVQAYSKINAQGLWIDRSETIDLGELFERMSRDELDRYAKEGVLPNWFPVRPQQEVKQNES
jgi:hypothetical protein